MKKRRRIFLMDLFGFIFLTILFCLFTIMAGISIYLYMSSRIRLVQCIIGDVMLFIGDIVCLTCIFYSLKQWVDMDANKISACTVKGVIRETTWDEIDTIWVLPLKTVKGIVGYQYFFIEKVEAKLDEKKTVNSKNSYIRVRACKRTRKFMLQCKPDLKFTNRYDDEV